MEHAISVDVSADEAIGGHGAAHLFFFRSHVKKRGEGRPQARRAGERRPSSGGPVLATSMPARFPAQPFQHEVIAMKK